MNIAIVGCGYLGTQLGLQLAGAGHRVIGVRRSLAEADPLQARGIEFVEGDVTRRESLVGALREAELVVNAVSSSRGGLETYREVYWQGTQNLLGVLQSEGRCRRYLHVSSTSVYAQCDGSWVDETSEACGASETSRVLVETEQWVLEAVKRLEQGGVVVRAAGIYGPGRGHLFQRYLAGEATMAMGGAQWINMVHVDDLARACAFLLTSVQESGVFNVVDNEPVTHEVFFRWLSGRLGRPMPLADEGGGGTKRKRGVTQKRVSNAKLGRLSTAWLGFPTFREGYAPEVEAALGRS